MSFNRTDESVIDANLKGQLSCDLVKTFDYSLRCDFVKFVEDCQFHRSFGNYITLYYCYFSPKTVYMAIIYIIFFLVLCFIFFLTLTYTVDMVLLPVLKVVCSVCAINEHLAGSTVLAAATCIPSFVITIAEAYELDDQEGFFSSLYASNLYYTIFMGGLIIVLTPFIMHPTNALRDTGFILVAILYADYVMSLKQCISTFDSILIFGIYFTYLAVVVVDEILLLRLLKRRTTFFSVPMYIIPLTITLPLAIVVFSQTRTDTPPAGHIVFAILTAAGCILVFYICTAEVLEILQVTGLILDCSEGMISATLVSWGLAMKDSVGNISIAMNGYQRMGYAACFGTAIFSSTLVVACNFLVRATSSKTDCIRVSKSSLGETSFCFLIMGLLLISVNILLLNCRARRSVGIFYIGFYFVFVTVSLLTELSVIHNYSKGLLYYPVL